MNLSVFDRTTRMIAGLGLVASLAGCWLGGMRAWWYGGSVVVH